MIRLWIDGKEIKAEEGQTILEVARKEGIYIPTLCYHAHLLPIGSCRLCIVEIEGFEKPQVSCMTPAIDGMKIKTYSERLFQMRQEFLRFILMEHPLDCPRCDKAGECRLQDLVYEHKIEKAIYRIETKKEEIEPYATPLIRKWNRRCVVCLRCYHACREISGRKVLEIEGHGLDAKIAVSDPSDCISCGECLNLCPVGALTESLSPMKTRPWMSKRVQSTCPHCGFGCAIIVESQDGFVTKILSDERIPPNNGSLCVRGRFGYDFVNDERRISAPYLRIYEEKRSLSFDEARTYLVERLKNIEKEGGTIGFLVSPRVTNEEIYLISKIASSFKNSVLSSSAFIQGDIIRALEERGFSLRYEYEEILDHDLVIAMGSDFIIENHLLGNKIREAVKKRGSKIIVLDPFPSSLSRIADLWVKVDPGTEGIFFDSISKALLEEGGFERENLEGFKEYREYLRDLKRQDLLSFCRIEERAFKKALKLIRSSKKVAVLFGPGFTKHDIEGLLNFSVLVDATPFAYALQSNALGLLKLLKNIVPPFELFKDQSIRALFIYEEEPFNYINEELILKDLEAKEFIVYFSPLPTSISSFVHLVFPSGTFTEKEGTFISENGAIRVLKRARDGIKDVSLLKEILFDLSGKTFEEEELREAVKDFKKEKKEKRFLFREKGEIKNGGYRVIFKDLFRNPYLEFSKGIELIHDDRIFISEEDGKTLMITEGDEIYLENERGRIKKKVSILPGLKSGIVVIQLFKERDILRLFEGIENEKVQIRKA